MLTSSVLTNTVVDWVDWVCWIAAIDTELFSVAERVAGPGAAIQRVGFGKYCQHANITHEITVNAHYSQLRR